MMQNIKPSISAPILSVSQAFHIGDVVIFCSSGSPPLNAYQFKVTSVIYADDNYYYGLDMINAPFSYSFQSIEQKNLIGIEEFNRYHKDKLKGKLKATCTCGAESIKSSRHYEWCDLLRTL